MSSPTDLASRVKAFLRVPVGRGSCQQRTSVTHGKCRTVQCCKPGAECGVIERPAKPSRGRVVTDRRLFEVPPSTSDSDDLLPRSGTGGWTGVHNKTSEVNKRIESHQTKNVRE